MKRGGPLARRTPLASGEKQLERRTRIKPESDKHRAMRPVREQVRATVMERDQGLCHLGLNLTRYDH